MDDILGTYGYPRDGTFHSSHTAFYLDRNRNYGSCHTYYFQLVADTGELPNPTIPTSLPARLSMSSEWIHLLGEIEHSSWKQPAHLQWGRYSAS